MCQNWSRVNLKFTIPGSAFVPKPDVDVAVVTLHPLTTPYIDHPFSVVNKVVTVVFQGKQKRLYNTVKNLFPAKVSRQCQEQMLYESGLKPTMRPIDLDMADWASLCNSYVRIIKQSPSLAKYRNNIGDPVIMDKIVGDQSDSPNILVSGA